MTGRSGCAPMSTELNLTFCHLLVSEVWFMQIGLCETNGLDSKSAGLRPLGVRFPLAAPAIQLVHSTISCVSAGSALIAVPSVTLFVTNISTAEESCQGRWHVAGGRLSRQGLRDNIYAPFPALCSGTL